MNVKIQSFVLGRKVFSADNWIRNEGGESIEGMSEYIVVSG